jgi:hypothetical protein
MLAHGFSIEQMVELVRAGLATARLSAWSPAATSSRSRACGSRRRGGGRFDCEETPMDDINRQDALRVHDRSRRVSEATDEATIKAGEVAIRTVMLINGGAAVSVLAFIGALVRQDGGLTIKQVAGVSNSLLWFGGGVAAGRWLCLTSPTPATCAQRLRRFSPSIIPTSSMVRTPDGGFIGVGHSTWERLYGACSRWSPSLSG